MPNAKINDTTLHYDVQGQGETLVFLHAGITDLSMWDAQVAEFAKKYRTIRYDMRGFGRSQFPENTFSHVHDLEMLLEYLKVEDAYLVGCSKGATLALDFTILYPDKVNGLMFVGSAPRGYQFTGEHPPIWKELKQAVEVANFDKAADLGLQIWLAGENRPLEQVNEQLREQVRILIKTMFENEVHSRGKEEKSDMNAMTLLADIKTPTFILIGREDMEDLVEVAEHMVSVMPNAKMTIMENTAHLPNMERPTEFNKLLDDFLNQLTS